MDERTPGAVTIPIALSASGPASPEPQQEGDPASVIERAATAPDALPHAEVPHAAQENAPRAEPVGADRARDDEPQPDSDETKGTDMATTPDNQNRMGETANQNAQTARDTLQQNSETARNAFNRGSETARNTFNQGAEAARNTMSQAADAARNNSEEMMRQGRAALEQVAERTRESMDRGMRAFDEFNTSARGNADAWMQASRAAAQGLEQVVQHAAEFSRKTFEEATSAMRTIATARTANEVFQVQNDYAKAQFDNIVNEMSRLTETMMRVTNDVFEPLSNRVADQTGRAGEAARNTGGNNQNNNNR